MVRAAACAAAALSSLPAAGAKRRANFVFIFGDDLRLDWSEAGADSVVHTLRPGFQPLQVERFAYPTAGEKTDETSPSIAQVSFTTADGRTIKGLLNLVGEEGEQRQLQAASSVYPDAEERIARLVGYLELLPQRDRYLARMAVPPPAGAGKASACLAQSSHRPGAARRAGEASPLWPGDGGTPCPIACGVCSAPAA